jgi:hypothetical protein
VVTTRTDPARKRSDLSSTRAISQPPATWSSDRQRRALPVPGDRHLFVDRSLPEYDEAAATLLTQRVLNLLSRVG